MASEARLEEMLAADISILDLDVMVIGRQYITDFGGRIDLLGIDSTGDLHRDEIDRRLEALRASVRTVMTIEGGVRWTGSPEQVNDDLRAICSGIRLGYEGKGKHRRLIPVGGIWKRPPMIDVWDSETGESMLHPDAVPATGGWYLPGSATAKSADERATA
jgi:hypothetical protein